MSQELDKKIMDCDLLLQCVMNFECDLTQSNQRLKSWTFDNGAAEVIRLDYKQPVL